MPEDAATNTAANIGPDSEKVAAKARPRVRHREKAAPPAESVRAPRPGTLRPGGRTERNRRKVAAAVLKLIEEGRIDFELQEVANLAEVHRTTLFRRWPDRASLIGEAVKEHVSRLSIALTGEWKEYLHRIAYAMRDFLSDPIELAMNRMMAVSDNEDFREEMFRYWMPLVESLREPIRKARIRGEVSREIDPSILFWTIIPPILVSAIFLRAPATDDFLDGLIAQAIRACR